MKLFTLFIFTFWILAICSFSKVQAFTTDDLLHPVAHGAGSYLLTHTGEVICRRLSDWDKTTCSIVSGVVATSIGVAVELTQPKEANHTKSYIENAAGVILAIGIIHLDF